MWLTIEAAVFRDVSECWYSNLLIYGISVGTEDVTSTPVILIIQS